jgi:hypothetical protein
MCLICIHFQAEKLTAQEAMNNLDEMAEQIGPEHARKVTAMIIESEIRLAEEEMGFEPIDDVDWIDIDFDVNFDDLFV